MLEHWIDGNGRAQTTPTSGDGRKRKGAKTAGQLTVRGSSSVLSIVERFYDHMVTAAVTCSESAPPQHLKCVARPGLSILTRCLPLFVLSPGLCFVFLSEGISAW